LTKLLLHLQLLLLLLLQACREMWLRALLRRLCWAVQRWCWRPAGEAATAAAKKAMLQWKKQQQQQQ
jgi:hypothetical protein